MKQIIKITIILIAAQNLLASEYHQNRLNLSPSINTIALVNQSTNLATYQTPLFNEFRSLQPGPSQINSRLTQPAQSIPGHLLNRPIDIPFTESYHVSQQTYLQGVAVVSAFRFIEQHKEAWITYNNVCNQLDNIAHIAQHGSMLDRMHMLPNKLNELAQAYDYLKPLYNEALRTGDMLTCTAIGHLQQEARNIAGSLRQELFDKHGALIEKPIKNFGKKIINRYKKQYLPDSRQRYFNAPDQSKEIKIKQHGLNITLQKVDQLYAQGDTKEAHRLIDKFLASGASRRYKNVLRTYQASNPHLNKYGIAKICEANPNWPKYEQELQNHPEKRDAIIDQLSQEQINARELCRQSGIRSPNPEQLYKAHCLNRYNNDPEFLAIARNAMQHPEQLQTCGSLLAQRDGALNKINDEMKCHPENANQLKPHVKELLNYATDPLFGQLVENMATSPNSIEECKGALAQRNCYIMQLGNQLGVEHFSQEAEQVAYLLSQAENNDQRFNTLGQLSSDSQYQGIRDAYETFYDQTVNLPRTHQYDQQLVDHVLELEIPSNLGTTEFSNERDTYTRAMLQPISSEQQRTQAKQYLNTLKNACISSEQQDAYRTLAHLEGQTYLNKEMQPTEEIRQQNISFFGSIEDQIRNGKLEDAANNMLFLDQEIQLNTDSPTPRPPRAQIFFDRHVSITINNNQQPRAVLPRSAADNQTVGSSQQHTQKRNDITDYTQLHDQIQAQNQLITEQQGHLGDYHKSREDALSKMINGDNTIYQTGYRLNRQAKHALKQAGIDTNEFATCKGNYIQQDTHAKLVKAVNQLANVEPQTAHGKMIKEGAFDCAYAGNVCNQNGMIEEAMIMTDVCQMACDITKGIYDGVCASTCAWWHHNTQTEPTLHAASSSSAVKSDVYQSTVTATGEFVDFILGSAERITRGTMGLAQGSVDGASQVSPLQNLKDIGQLLVNSAQFGSECSVHLVNITDHLAHGEHDRARIEFDTLNQKLNSAGQSIMQTLDTISDTIDYAISQAPQTPDEWQEAGKTVGTIATKVGVENYLTGKCLQGASKIVRGVGRSLNNIDQTAKEIKMAHGLSGAPMPKPSAAKPQIVKTIPKETVANPYRTFSSPQAAGDVAHVSQAPTLQPTPATSSTSSSISARFAPIVQAGKKFFAEPQPGYIDLSNQQKTTPAAGLKLQDVLTRDGKKIDVNKLDLDNLPIHLYDESIVDLSKLQELTNQFKDIPGAMGKDGPLQKLLEMGYEGANSGNFAAARGALYELEVARKAIRNGETVLKFGEKIHVKPHSPREFDIITPERIIECKNIDWNILNQKTINKMKGIFANQNKIAEATNKKFIVYSKKTIPAHWRNWFDKKNILYVQGL